MASQNNAYLKMTGDDLRASRVLTLAIKFFATRSAIASSTIARDLYPGLDERSFNRQYLRDRELLATFGLVVRAVDDNGGDTLWHVDEGASYVQDEVLTPADARMLYVLCHDLVYDRSFAYRDELRMALAKISQMYRGTPLGRTEASPSADRKILQTLVAAMGNRVAVAATYTDAHGATSERNLALLGSFGLHGHTYFVASRVEKDGTLLDNSVRTYRLDRFSKARELRNCIYEVPQDFCVNDYERLPFQIGDATGTARFLMPEEPTREVMRAAARSGCIREEAATASAAPRTTWNVSYSSPQTAAAWAVGVGLMPLDPPELVDAYHAVLTQAQAHDPFDLSLSDATAVGAEERKLSSKGRTGSVTVARQLVALATSLTREGRVISARDIADTLDVDYDYARHLIALVSMTGGESYDYLPVVLGDNDDEVSLMEGALTAARRVRLTRSESMALQAALAELGVAQTDPLSQALARSFASPAFSLDDISRSLESPAATGAGPALRTCSLAISAGKGLSFTYRPVSGGAVSTRRVIPRRVRRTDDTWYLDAYDLMRADDRVFRVDHMSNVSEITAPGKPVQDEQQPDEHLVLVRFDDPLYLDLYAWDRLEILQQTANHVLVRMPLYRGTWLAQHLLACGNKVHVGSKTLAEQMQQLAKER